MRHLLAAVAALMLAGRAQATTIEGYTPQGNFQTVYVSDTGRLFVDIDSSTPQHVIVDAGTMTHITDPVQVFGVSGGPVAVSGPSGSPIQVSGTFVASASTSSTVSSSQIGITATPFAILAIDVTRKQSILCNQDPTLTVWIGGATVAANNGIALGAGGCMSPDVPTSFTGALFGISSTTTTGKIGKLEFF